MQPSFSQLECGRNYMNATTLQPPWTWSRAGGANRRGLRQVRPDEEKLKLSPNALEFDWILSKEL